MFCIHQLQLFNFKSFKSKHKINLPAESGLFFLTGKNLDEPELGSNGAGKSTIEDAIYWVLYGRTLRGLKGGDIITRGEKTASGAVLMTVGDREFTVRRTQAPNSLTIIEGGVETQVEQEALTKLLRLNPTAFTYSVIMPQFNQAFFDLLPSQQLTLFSEIMDLDYWLVKSKQAGELTDALKRELNTVTHTLANNRGRVEVLTEDLDTLDIQSHEFEATQNGVVSGLTDKLNRANKNKTGYEDELKKATKEVAQCKRELTTVSIDEHENKARIRALNAERQELASMVAVALSETRTAKASINALGALGAKCDTCGQPIDKTHLRGQQTALGAVQKAAEGRLKVAQLALADLDADIQQETNIEDVRKISVTASATELREAEAEESNIQQALNGVLRDLTNLKAQIKVEDERPNPYEAQLLEKRSALTKLKVGIAADTKKSQELEIKVDANGYWVNGFKRIRLSLIEETLRTLEIEVNNSLVNLGLTEWRVEFDIERENKSGGITKGFTVLVYPPGCDTPIKWESFSGGEVQRLRLAGDLGLANLIMTQAGLVNQIEIYDEPSEHLSPEGLLDLAETLANRASDRGITICLIDHHTIEFGDFAGTMVVTKVDGSSHFA